MLDVIVTCSYVIRVGLGSYKHVRGHKHGVGSDILMLIVHMGGVGGV